MTKADIRRVANQVFVASNRTSAEIETEAPAAAAKNERTMGGERNGQDAFTADPWHGSRNLPRMGQTAFRWLDSLPPFYCQPDCDRACRAGVYAPAQQAKPWEQIPVPKLHDFKPQQPKRIELKNGIVVFLAGGSRAAVYLGSVLIPGGSRDERMQPRAGWWSSTGRRGGPAARRR